MSNMESQGKKNQKCLQRYHTPYKWSYWRNINVDVYHGASYVILRVDILYIYWRGGQANFFKRPQIANPQILGLIPQPQIRKFQGIPVRKSQIRKFLFLLFKPQAHKFQQYNAQLFLKTDLKVVFLLDFY